MPRVTHVKKARKDNPAVKKGESYFWWKFRYGGKRYSATRPRGSQLTQSAYYSTVRAMCEGIEDYSCNDADDVMTLADDIRSQLDDLRDETQGSLDNMPDSLQYSPTGELLQERIDALENAECEMDVDEFEFDDEEEFIREPFDDDEEFDSDEERDAAESDHEHEQDELESDHEQNQEEERKAALDTYIQDTKEQLHEAVANCEV